MSTRQLSALEKKLDKARKLIEEVSTDIHRENMTFVNLIEGEMDDVSRSVAIRYMRMNRVAYYLHHGSKCVEEAGEQLSYMQQGQ